MPKSIFILVFAVALVTQQKTAIASKVENCLLTLDHTVRLLNSNKTVRLCEEYRNKVVLIVNTASKCAFTDQYAGLEKLYDKYKEQGLVVLGFPSNNFANQEPGTEQKVQAFCRLTYGVQFPMFAKSNVQKHNADPLYRALAKISGNYPQWNFHKYLLDRNGQFVTDYPSTIDPLHRSVISEVEKLLGE